MTPQRRAIGVSALAGLGLLRRAVADTDAATVDPRVRASAARGREVEPPLAHAFTASGLAEGETR